MVLTLPPLPARPLSSFLLTLALLLWAGVGGSAQSAATPIGTDSLPPEQPAASRIVIRWSDDFFFEISGTDTLKRMVGHVELTQDTVFMTCDSALLRNSDDVFAWGNFILQQGDSLTIFSDSARYNGRTGFAELFGQVVLLKGNQRLFTNQLTYDKHAKTAIWRTGAVLTRDTTRLTSRRGYYHTESGEIFFGDSVRVADSDFQLRSDTLAFHTHTGVASFLGPTLLAVDSALVYTESGFFDTKLRKAAFTLRPQYRKGDERAWAQSIRYDVAESEITLSGDAHVEDSTTLARAAFIRHREKDGFFVLRGAAFVDDRKAQRLLKGDTIFYQEEPEVYFIGGDAHIEDGDQIVDADTVAYDGSADQGTATGRVIWQDTLEKTIVRCAVARFSKGRDYLQALGDSLRPRPLLIRMIDGDSLFIAADTLLSFRLTTASTDSMTTAAPPADSSAAPTPPSDSPTPPLLPETAAPADTDADSRFPEVPGRLFDPDTLRAEPSVDRTDLQLLPEVRMPAVDSLLPTDSTGSTATGPVIPPDSARTREPDRLILAYHDVRIFKSDLQAVCDSLTYSTADSMFRLFVAPVIWSDTSQFTADTTFIQLADDQIDRIYLRQNAFIVNSPDLVFFNQVKGRNSTAYFREGDIHRVRVRGNAASTYYPRDDADAYLGVIESVCSDMVMEFGEGGSVEGIRFYAQPTMHMSPMREADHDALRMEGFSWQENRRPVGVEGVLAPRRASGGGGGPAPASSPQGRPAVPPAEPEK